MALPERWCPNPGRPVRSSAYGASVTFFRKQLERGRRQRDAFAYAKAFHLESRARVAPLADSGRGHVAMSDNLALMAIDNAQAERPRLVTIGGVRY